MNLLQKIFVIAGLSASAVLTIAEAETVEDRLKPIGELCMAGEPCAAAAVAAAGGELRSGETVYSTKCFTCHATGAAGAPKLGDPAAWQARIDERGVDGMHKSAWEGYKAMPAKGLCMDCSEEEVSAAVDYILESI